MIAKRRIRKSKKKKRKKQFRNRNKKRSKVMMNISDIYLNQYYLTKNFY